MRSLVPKLFSVAFAFAVMGLGACNSPSSPKQVLLFAGTGTSPNDVVAIEKLLERNRLGYATVDSGQLNAMSEEQIRRFHLLIIPGGDFIKIGSSLTPEASARIHRSVEHGVNYLGICAGAFLAGSSAPNALDLASGTKFGFYAAEDRGIRRAAIEITSADSTKLDQYWEDGPQLAGWGEVVSRYPDGTPATIEARSGQGFVVLTGVHPEAPQSWRKGMAFLTPVEEDNEYALALIRAALNGTSLPHF